MNFFLLLTDAFSCFLYGIVVTAVIMVILYFVLKTLSQGIVRTPVFYITGVVLAVLLLIQTSLMIGAIQAKDAVDSALIYMNQLLENYSGIVGANDSQQILDAVTEEFPIIGVYLNLADFSGNAVSDLAESIHETMSDYLNSYIWHYYLRKTALAHMHILEEGRHHQKLYTIVGDIYNSIINFKKIKSYGIYRFKS